MPTKPKVDGGGLPRRCPRCHRPYVLDNYLELVMPQQAQVSLATLVALLQRKGVPLPEDRGTRLGMICNALKRNPERFRKVERGVYERVL